jgi:hypothetical protein
MKKLDERRTRKERRKKTEERRTRKKGKKEEN